MTRIGPIRGIDLVRRKIVLFAQTVDIWDAPLTNVTSYMDIHLVINQGKSLTIITIQPIQLLKLTKSQNL